MPYRTTSGEAKKFIVFAFPSLRLRKLRLNEVRIAFSSSVEISDRFHCHNMNE